jgi:hypothetical protein
LNGVRPQDGVRPNPEGSADGVSVLAGGACANARACASAAKNTTFDCPDSRFYGSGAKWANAILATTFLRFQRVKQQKAARQGEGEIELHARELGGQATVRVSQSAAALMHPCLQRTQKLFGISLESLTSFLHSTCPRFQQRFLFAKD